MPNSSNINGPALTGRRVDQAIAAASHKTGVDFDFLMNQAQIESAMDPSARASTSSAVGLFQFTSQTWLATLKAHGAEHQMEWAADAISQSSDGSYRVDDPGLRATILDLRTSPEASSAMAGEFAADNAQILSGALGRPTEPVDLYLAHFLGANGAVRFLNAHQANPDTAAASLLPKAAAANRPIFYHKNGTQRSVGEIRELFAAKIAKSGSTVRWANTSQPGTGASVRWQTRSSQMAATPAMPVMREIEPMPKALSLRFAAQAYQRLAGLGGGVRS